MASKQVLIVHRFLQQVDRFASGFARCASLSEFLCVRHIMLLTTGSMYAKQDEEGYGVGDGVAVYPEGTD
jgi:hypothetical protein